MSKKIEWSDDDIQELISEYKKRPILWDTSRRDNKDRTKKDKEWKNLAGIFDTTVSNTQRKIQNLRTQYNDEMKKLSKRKTSKRKSINTNTEVWPYLEALHFINDAESDSIPSLISPRKRKPSSPIIEETPVAESDHSDDLNIDYSMNRSFEKSTRISPETSRPLKRRKLVESPSNDNFLNEYSTIHQPIVRKSLETYRRTITTSKEEIEPEENVEIESSASSAVRDEYDAFGTFVASELRNLKYESNRKRLKCIIQRSILEMSEEDSKLPTSPSLYPNLSVVGRPGLSPLKQVPESFRFNSFQSGLSPGKKLSDSFRFNSFQSELNPTRKPLDSFRFHSTQSVTSPLKSSTGLLKVESSRPSRFRSNIGLYKP